MAQRSRGQNGRLYLDHAATSPLLPEVATKMTEVIEQLSRGEFGNASSLHSPGQFANHTLNTARKHVARLINAEPDEIIFTSGGSEANNTVTNIFAGRHLAVSAVEHPSLLESARARAGGLTILPVNRYGQVELAAIPNDADLVSVMLANNELGTIQPIAEIAKKLQKNRTENPQNMKDSVASSVNRGTAMSPSTFLHSDATQALGKIHLDVKALGVDYLTLSAHKIGGPVGVGALYVRRGTPFRPLIIGGHQENKRRAGTSNVLLAAGFGEAARLAWDNWSCQQYKKVAELRNELVRRILAEVPHSSANGFVECQYDEDARNYNTLPNVANLSFQAAEGESIQLYLDLAGIAVSTGSACAAGDTRPSHVLMATSGDAEVAHSSIRFSLGPNTTRADLDQVIRVLPDIVRKLQGISTVKIVSEAESSRNRNNQCTKTAKQDRKEN